METKGGGIVLLLALGALLFSSAVENQSASIPAPQGVPAWEVSGLVSEACPCDPVCPCWFNKKPTLGHCDSVQVFKIEKGHYGDIPLQGLVVISAAALPEGETILSGAAKLKLLAFYVNKSTTQQQREAIEKIWRNHIFSIFKAPRGELKAVRLIADVRTDYAKASIPSILTYEVSEWKDKRAKLVSHLHGWPVYGDVRQGSSVKYRYSDYGLSWTYPGKNAIFSTFKAHPGVQTPP